MAEFRVSDLDIQQYRLLLEQVYQAGYGMNGMELFLSIVREKSQQKIPLSDGAGKVLLWLI